MRNFLLTSILTMALALTLNAADQLAVAVEENADATVYNLQLQQGQEVRTIWSKRVPLINGEKPDSYAGLRVWEKNEHGILALIENNEQMATLLQFNTNGDLLTEVEGSGYWLQAIRLGGSVKLEPPDMIEVTNPVHGFAKFLIRDGRLADKDGKFLERPEPLWIGKNRRTQRSESSATTPDFGPTPPAVEPPAPKAPETKATTPTPGVKPERSTPVKESPAPTRWPVVAGVVAVALGLLWLLLKKRK
ncbi:MAG TPA: hypothetical protein VGO90_01445 [Chthoniobacteraceae bacterium]|nr:hypothetical protein [Chthoniobacteraceae bacterium]